MSVEDGLVKPVVLAYNVRKTQVEEDCMIGYLEGQILSYDEARLLLKVQGVGYELYMGAIRESQFGGVGDRLALWVHTHVREDQITLFGFTEAIQKRIFQVLIGVNGIGPKLAMAVISQLGPGELLDAVTMSNVKLLCTVPGVGKKMADRLVLELRDKLAGVLQGYQGAGAVDIGQGSLWNDLAEALNGLGFPDQKIRNVIVLARKELADKPIEINELLKFALQKIKHC